VRVIFSCVPQTGHIVPLLPLAQAFAAQGDDVTIASGPDAESEVLSRGLSFLPVAHIAVPAGTRVSIEVVNADSDMAHGLVITATSTSSSWMPMMSAALAFNGSALWFLGASTSAGMQEGTVSFTASEPGTYQCLCPVPGHAQEGMVGEFIVKRAP